MNQLAYQEIAKMLNAFPQSAKNIEALLLTYDEDLREISDQAICETAQRYRRNEIPEQNKTFAPSIAEFVDAARKQTELISIRERPRLRAPEPYYSGGMPPFMVTRQRLLAENANRQVLHENIGFDQFKKLSVAREIPVGAKWVAALGIVYGPEAKRGAAE